MHMKKILGALIGLAFTTIAQAQDALVVTTCGTLPQAYSAGTSRLMTVDVNGKLCLSTTGGVTSVSNADGTLTISPTTGAVVASINLNHANTWAGQQTFVAPILGTPASGTVTNLTGTASININGTVGATTPTTGAFTTGAFSSPVTVTSASAAALTIGPTGATNPLFTVDASVGMIAVNNTSGGGLATFTRYVAAAGAGSLTLSHARGTLGSPSNLNNDDRFGEIDFGGYTSGAFNNAQAVIASFLDGASGSRMAFGVSPAASVTSAFAWNLSRNTNFTGVAGAAWGWVPSTTDPSNGGGGTIPDAALTRKGVANVQFGLADAAVAVAQTISVQSVVAGTAAANGANWTLIGSLPTGTGTSGDIIIQTGVKTGSGTTQGTATTALTIKGETQAVVTSALDAASSAGGALQIAGGASVAKRFWIPAITASAGLQTAVLCQSSGGEMIADSVACLASSEKFKEDIQPSDMGLETVMALKPIIYRYRKTGNDRFDSAPNQRDIHAGFSAEQAASVDSRLVARDKDGSIRTIRPDAVPAALVLAVQELTAKVQRLEAR